MFGKLIKLAFRLLSLLSLNSTHRLGRLVGDTIFKLGGRSVVITRKNLQACYPSLNSDEIENLSRNNLQETSARLLSPTPKDCRMSRGSRS